MRKDVVPIYSISGNPNPLRHVSRDLAVKLLLSGGYSPITKGRGKSEELCGLRMKHLEKLAKDSPATITFSEVVRNGFANMKKLKGGKGRTIFMSEYRKDYEDIEPDAAERAVNKIKAWPTVGDTKAVCVRPRAAFA
jgi:hypothetical protein